MFYKLLNEQGEVTTLYKQDVPVPFAEEITESEYDKLLEEMMSRKPVESTDPTNTYGIPDEIYHSIIDDYTLEMLESEGLYEQ